MQLDFIDKEKKRDLIGADETTVCVWAHLKL